MEGETPAGHLLFVGRLRIRKGVEVLLHAQAAASARFTLVLRPAGVESTLEPAEAMGNDFWEFIRSRMDASVGSGRGR